jgi:ribonuclease Z
MTVQTLPLRHSVPVVGFIFREKPKLLNIKKDKILQYNLGIKEMRSIKEGNDLVRPDGTFVPNSELTLPPVKPRSFAFCTDTSSFPSLVESLKNIDLLYFEATFIHEDRKLARLTSHSTSVQAATLAKKAAVGKLVMGHFSNRYKGVKQLLAEATEIFPMSFAAEDGDSYTIPEVREDRIIQ